VNFSSNGKFFQTNFVNNIKTHSLYRVYTKEWCGFKS